MDPREKTKAILIAIVRAAGGSFNGKTRLYKAFYVAHLFHFRDQRGVLSDHPMVRMPRGPAVDSGDMLLAELCNAGFLRMSKRPNGPYTEEVFAAEKDYPVNLSTAESESVRRAVEWIGEWSARELSEWTHEFSNTWADTDDGHPMNIYADLLSESDYEQMKRLHNEVGSVVHVLLA